MGLNRRSLLLFGLVLLAPSSGALAQAAGDPTGYASAANVQAQVEDMRKAMFTPARLNM